MENHEAKKHQKSFKQQAQNTKIKVPEKVNGKKARCKWKQNTLVKRDKRKIQKKKVTEYDEWQENLTQLKKLTSEK